MLIFSFLPFSVYIVYTQFLLDASSPFSFLNPFFFFSCTYFSWFYFDIFLLLILYNFSYVFPFLCAIFSSLCFYFHSRTRKIIFIFSLYLSIHIILYELFLTCDIALIHSIYDTLSEVSRSHYAQ